jgi:PAS domain S-box-containing protein
LKLGTKLISSFVGVIILLLIIGLASQYFNSKVKNRVVDESRGAVKLLEISGEMEAYLYRSFIDAQYYLDQPYRTTVEKDLQDSPISPQNVKRKIRIALQGLNLNLKKIDRLLKSDEYTQATSEKTQVKDSTTVVRLNNRMAFYNSLMEQMLDYDESNFQEAKKLLAITIDPYYRSKLLPIVQRFRNQIGTNLDKQVVMLNNRLTRYSNILTLATILAFVFSLILAFLLYRSITKPLHSLAQAAEEIGRGNLDKRIRVKTDDVIGNLGRSFNRMAENLDKTTFSKEYVDDILKSMGDALIVTDKQKNITKINAAALKMLEYKEDELINKSLSEVFIDNSAVAGINGTANAVIENLETHFKKKDEELVPVNLSKTIISNKNGRIQSLVYVAGDITEFKKSERLIKESLEEKEILLSEIHHRVKNNLAVISGLLQMQRWESKDEAAREVLQDSQLRVKSIALVHEKLYQSSNLSNIDFERYINELIEGINQTFNNSETHINFNVDVEPLLLSINQAIPCSLLINELVVNIHKHAFNGISEGEVGVKLWKEGKDVHLIVRDNGKGLHELPGDSSEQSLGMSLVHTLAAQIDGEVQAYNEEGAVFEIIFKLEES